MKQVKVKKDEFDEKYITFTIKLKLKAHLDDKYDDRTEMPLDEAKQLVARELDYLAGSNTGSEKLLNAEPKFKTIKD